MTIISMINPEITKNMTTAEKWIVEHSELTMLEDGTISLFFEGKLPSRMIAQLRRAEIEKFSGRLQSSEFGTSCFRTGKKMSTQNAVKYNLDDWTEPLLAQKARSAYRL